MRSEALTQGEKEMIEKTLRLADLMPARGGQVIINLDPQKKVTSVEVKAVLR